MKEIIFVTSNQGKYSSARSFLEKYGIRVIQENLEVPEPRGALEEIAVHKAMYAFRLLKRPLITMDAGFFIRSLNGFPQIFTNFVLETIGVEGIIKLTENRDRKCEFREVLCYLENLKEKPRLFKRVVKGKISERPLGRIKPYHWSRLALIFIPDNESKTMAEMTNEEFINFRKRVDADSHWERFGRFFAGL